MTSDGRDRRMLRVRAWLGFLGVVAAAAAVLPVVTPSRAAPAPPSPLSALSWRNIGPLQGGRSIAVSGSTARPDEYYFGATGGGVWKTTDGGTTWNPVSDGFLSSSSVGALAVCPANPDVVYAGTGEVDLRTNTVQGDGMYKTTDGGKTWQHVGLADTQTISRIGVDPQDCDHVYAAALGHPYGPNTQRGVFRTTDGGATWTKVLYVDDLTGAADVELDPKNPQVLYASMWHVFRKPWQLSSGGPGSGIWKSTDGGDHWTDLSANPGLPAAPLGRIGLSVSPADPNRVWAMVEAKVGEGGGLFVSDDAGATWRVTTTDPELSQRPFYFFHVFADPQDADTVYVDSLRFFKSTDAGKTFEDIDTPHTDQHDLWIDPTNPRRMVEANDGGANVSVNGGQTWTTQDFSTAQMYHVAVTNDIPYLVCGEQQDSDGSCVPSDGDGSQRFSPGGGEGGQIAVDPTDSRILFSGQRRSIENLFVFNERYGTTTNNQVRNIGIWPDDPVGHPARDAKERQEWEAPVVTSPADPKAVYTASQHVFRSTDQGHSWQQISPDLSRDDASTQGDSGGPINPDQSTGEYFGTVYTVAPSPLNRRVIWAGSDDGLVHVTRDFGRTWTDVTPPGLPHFIRIALIDASPYSAGTAYLAAQNYRLDDFAPYVFKTTDYGRHWTKITTGLPANEFVWVVRQDPVNRNLLYAGTEHSSYVSFDDGAHWQSLRLNMPDTPVHDMTTHGDDLVIATFGRGFYVLHGLSLLRQSAPGGQAAPSDVVAPARKQRGRRLGPDLFRPAAGPAASPDRGQSAADDAATLFRPTDVTRSVDSALTVFYDLRQAASSVSLTVRDARGQVVRTFTGLPASAGTQSFRWNLQYPGPVTVPGISSRGPKAPLGRYTVQLTVDGDPPLSQPFSILKDPRLTTVSAHDIQQQFQFGEQVVARTSAADQGVKDIQSCDDQVDARIAAAGDPQVTASGHGLEGRLDGVSAALYQPSDQEDKLPVKLNDKISTLLRISESADGLPTVQTLQVFQDLDRQLTAQLDELGRIVAGDVAEFNHLLASRGLPPVSCQG